MIFWAAVLALLAGIDRWYRARLPEVPGDLLFKSAPSVDGTFEEVMAASGPWPAWEV